MEAKGATQTAPITVQWHNEQRDFFEAYAFRWKRDRWTWRIGIVAFVVVGVLSELVDSDPTLWLPPYVVAVAMAIYQFVWIPSRIRRRARSLVGETAVVSVDEEGVRSDMAGFHEQTEWRMLTDLVASSKMIAIRREQIWVYSIPTRAFATPAEAEAFLAYVRFHLGTNPGGAPLSHPASPPTVR